MAGGECFYSVYVSRMVLTILHILTHLSSQQSKEILLLTPFYRRGNWGKLSNLSKVTQVFSVNNVAIKQKVYIFLLLCPNFVLGTYTTQYIWSLKYIKIKFYISKAINLQKNAKCYFAMSFGFVLRRMPYL